MIVPIHVVTPKQDLVRLQEHGQSNGDGNDTGQKLAGSKAEGSASVTLSASSAGGTNGAGGGRPRALGRGRRNGGRRNTGRGSTGERAGGRTSNWEGAGAVDLVLLICSESSGHSRQCELGREGQGGVLGRVRILEGERLNSDETEREWKKRSRQSQ